LAAAPSSSNTNTMVSLASILTQSSDASLSRGMSAEVKTALLYVVKTPIGTRRDAAFSLASSV
jgi:hypothetical protein